MPSIRQIAQLAGVSAGTVSRALNNQPGVGKEVRERIVELARLYHYRPNRALQGLVTGSNMTLGYLIPTLHSPYCAMMLQGALQAAFAESYHFIILQTDHQRENTKLALQTLVEQRVAGVLVDTGHLDPIPQSCLLELRSHDIACVAMDATTSVMPIDAVRTNEDALAEMAVQYLYKLGHRYIAYINTKPQGHLALRTRAMRNAFRRLQLPTDGFLDAFSQQASEMLSAIYQALPSCTAVIVMQDEVAASLMQQAAGAGIAIPGELSVLSCGNFAMSPHLLPPLTTIEQNPEQVGSQAVALLLRRIREGIDPATFLPEVALIDPQLIIRSSCAPTNAHGRRRERGIGSKIANSL